LKGRERMGSSLPPAELARRDSALFEKIKCIFSIAPVGNLRKSLVAPDVEPVRPVYCQCLALLGLGTGRQAPDTG